MNFSTDDNLPPPQANPVQAGAINFNIPVAVVRNAMLIAEEVVLIENLYQPNQGASYCVGLLQTSLIIGIFILQLSVPYEELSQGNPYLIEAEIINLLLFISAIFFACAYERMRSDDYILDTRSLSTRFIKNTFEFYGIGLSRTDSWTLFMLGAVAFSDTIIFQCASANLSLSLENKKYNSDIIAAQFTPLTACILTFLFAHLSNGAMKVYNKIGLSFFSSRGLSEAAASSAELLILADVASAV